MSLQLEKDQTKLSVFKKTALMCFALVRLTGLTWFVSVSNCIYPKILNYEEKRIQFTL